MVATLPDGWRMQRLVLDGRGYDQNGWRWRADAPTWWLTDGADSLTVVARSPVEALWLAMRDGWPPRRLHRYQQPWDYGPREGPLPSDTSSLHDAERRLWELHYRFIARSGHAAGSDDDVRFLALALAGEVGEVANIIKKSWRGYGDGLSMINLYDELSDVFAYWALLVHAVGSTAEEIATRSVTKAQAKIAELEERRGDTP